MTRHASPALAAFITAAELGAFAAAGRVLGISAAAVGQNVKRLEDQFGVKLFNRTTRKMSLTPEGTLLYQRARGPLRELDEIEALFDESRGVVSGVVRITAPKRVARKLVVPLIAAFRDAHPKVEVDLDASDTVRDFVDDPVDIAFRNGAPVDSTMISRPISQLPLLTVGAPAYFEQRGAPRHPQDLIDHECLRYRFPETRELWLWAFEIEGEISRHDPPGGLVFNDPETMLEAASAGLGLVQMDTFYGAEHLADGRLVPVMEEFATTISGLYLSYPNRTNMPLRVRRFIDFVMERLPRDCFAKRRAPSDLPAPLAV
ncbi:MAG: LysR family transcriptional regulator [Pseudomonadota bacterium]